MEINQGGDMNKTWVKLALVGMITAAAANADHAPGHTGAKGMTMGGSAEAGWQMGFTSGTPMASHFLVDHASMWMNAEVSDKLKFVVNNAFAVTDGGGVATGRGMNTATYFSGARLTTAAGTGTQFTFANNAAYVEHKCMDGLTTAVGHFMTPFGMEGLSSRYDMSTYYYSAAANQAFTLGWMFDLGFKWTATDYVPGTLEVALIDGHRANLGGESVTPSAVARWWYEVKGGDWSFTPVVSTYLGRWRGGPKDLGITAGGMFKAGTLFANAEWVYTSQDATMNAGAKTKNWSLYLEPGMDLGLAKLSVKWDYNSVDAGAGSTNDMNLGAALTKDYSDKLRIRAVYMFANMSKKLAAASTHDVRLLFGTKW